MPGNYSKHTIFLTSINSIHDFVNYIIEKDVDDLLFTINHTLETSCLVKLDQIEQQYRKVEYYDFIIPSQFRNYFVDLYYNV